MGIVLRYFGSVLIYIIYLFEIKTFTRGKYNVLYSYG